MATTLKQDTITTCDDCGRVIDRQNEVWYKIGGVSYDSDEGFVSSTGRKYDICLDCFKQPKKGS